MKNRPLLEHNDEKAISLLKAATIPVSFLRINNISLLKAATIPVSLVV